MAKFQFDEYNDSGLNGDGIIIASATDGFDSFRTDIDTRNNKVYIMFTGSHSPRIGKDQARAWVRREIKRRNIQMVK